MCPAVYFRAADLLLHHPGYADEPVFYICYLAGHPVTSQMADLIRLSQQTVQLA